MLHSDTISELAAALAAAQGEVKAAALDGENPHYGSRYATLSALWAVVRAAFPKHGLSIVQGAAENGSISTTILHTSGQWITLAGLPMKAVKDDPQGVGSLLTYARRYGLAAAAGLVADDDDDANAATGKPAPEKADEKPAAKAPAEEVTEIDGTIYGPVAPKTIQVRGKDAHIAEFNLRVADTAAEIVRVTAWHDAAEQVAMFSDGAAVHIVGVWRQYKDMRTFYASAVVDQIPW
jgi:hypothetical protein